MPFYDKAQALEKIKRLVDDFGHEIEYYKAGNETSEAIVEDKYIKPLFQYLNWNIHNERLAHGKEEFIVQYRLKSIGKKPDYLLRIPDHESNQMKHILFMEAKHPKYDLLKDIRWIRQCYLYANSTLAKSERPERRVSLSLLTDFEEFRLFDCRDPEPLELDDINKYNRRAVKPFDHWDYLKYESEFDVLWDTFEFNQIVKGSLNAYRISEEQLKDSRIAPDTKFLDYLKKWRIELATDMYKNASHLSEDVLTAATQLLLNRLVFLKMLVDKDLETDYLTQIIDKIKVTKIEDISFYESCKDIFSNLHKTFNGSIFERRAELDSVKVSNTTLGKILDSLRPEKALYTFDAMPVRVVGTMYEEFLGEVIKIKEGQIGTEQKPEVRKAGGVYYTPEYIVDFILESTLDNLLRQCKNPEDVGKIKICDPACGSGSFLIAAYERLLLWHQVYYEKETIKLIERKMTFQQIQNRFKDHIYINVIDDGKKSFSLTLSIKLKSKILLNSMYGVDIDSQAVEVTKLSLCMKAVEDYYNRDELYNEVNLFKTTILPDLSNNIECGNSLVNNEIHMTSLDDFEKDSNISAVIKPFDWSKRIAPIADGIGFDIVIGNPPWGADIDKILEYLRQKYPNSTRQHTDIFKCFIEKAISLLKDEGVFSFIVPNTLLRQSRFEDIRQHLLNYQLDKIVDIGDGVFERVTAPACIIVVIKKKSVDNTVKLLNLGSKTIEDKIKSLNKPDYISADQKTFDLNTEKQFAINLTVSSCDEILKVSRISIKDAGINYQRTNVGMQEKGKSDLSGRLLYEAEMKENGSDIMYWKGEDINFYSIKTATNRFCRTNKSDILRDNEVATLNLDYFKEHKLLIRQTADRIIAAYDDRGIAFGRSLIGVTIAEGNENEYLILLGLLNSKYLTYCYRDLTNERGRSFAQVKKSKLLQLPLPKDLFMASMYVDGKKAIIEKVKYLIMANTRLNDAEAKTKEETESLIANISRKQGELDAIIFAMFGLSPDKQNEVNEYYN